MTGPVGPEVSLGDKKYLYFAGTSYYQLHAHPEIIEAACEATRTYGMGPATIRDRTGTTPLISLVERSISCFFGSKDAVYLPSGYLSSIAGINALSNMDLFDAIFIDEDAHYSLSDAAESTGKKVYPYKNCSPEDLVQQMKKHLQKGERPLIATDGVFPVHGYIAPLDKYLGMAEKHRGVIWVDDAHGSGILGKSGKGTCEHLGIESRIIYTGSTLSKAFGSYGGIIAGNTEFIREIRKGNVYNGTSAPTNAAVASSIKGLQLVQDNPGWRKSLQENANYLRNRLTTCGFNFPGSSFPVITLKCGTPGEMLRIQHELMNEGIYIQFTRYRGAGTEGVLRIVVFSTHSTDQINRLISALDTHIPVSIRQETRATDIGW